MTEATGPRSRRLRAAAGSLARRSRQRRWSAWLGVAVLLVAMIRAAPALASSPQSLSAVSLSSHAAGATGVTYTFSFAASTTGALVSGEGVITVAGPVGTVLPGCFAATDVTTSSSVGACSGSSRDNGQTESYVVEGDVGAGDTIAVVLKDVTNPGVLTGATLGVSTSSDTTAAHSPTYEIGFAAAPAVSGVEPRSGTTAGGTVVTITGTSFTSATDVTFGSAAATSLTVDSDTQITTTSPPGTGTIDVTVTTPAGTSPTASADQFTYTTISSSAPAPSPAPAGPAVTAPPAPPAVAEGAARNVTSTTAQVTGTVNPNGLFGTAHFEYGLDPRYAGGGPVVFDHVTPDVTVSPDTSPQPVSAILTGLVPNALYDVRLVASNADGTLSSSDQTFTTAREAPPPPPVLGTSVNLKPVSGTVLVKPPPGKSLQAIGPATAHLTKGTGFVPLTEARQLPAGSQVDALSGTLQLTTATTRRHVVQVATLSGGIFSVRQTRTGLQKGLTTFQLLEGDFPGAPSYKDCNTTARATGAAHRAAYVARLSPTVLQTLHAHDHGGHFTTRGRYGAATVRGTVWDTSDRCDGTLMVVHRGTVVVTDFRRKAKIIVHAGHSYLAKAP